MALTALIHMTAAYSNAVLVAILPHVNDFAKKLDLPLPLPITTSQVMSFKVNPMQGFVGGGIWLTNDCQFIYANGFVNSYKLLKGNPFLTQDPAQDWPHYIGKENINTNDAIELARNSLRKLGYDPKELHADVPPYSIEGSYDLKEGHFPYCQIKWQKVAETPQELGDAVSLTFQINMTDKTIIGLSMFGRKLWQPNPQIDVVPETEAEYSKVVNGKMLINTNAPPTILHNNSN